MLLILLLLYVQQRKDVVTAFCNISINRNDANNNNERNTKKRVVRTRMRQKQNNVVVGRGGPLRLLDPSFVFYIPYHQSSTATNNQRQHSCSSKLFMMDGWSCTASLPESFSSTSNDEDGLTEVAHVRTEIKTRPKKKDVNGVEYDLSSPREWMEYLGNKEDHNALGGAYTVLRCDLRQSTPRPVSLVDDMKSINHNDDRYFIWGEQFHLNRLSSSYDALSCHNSHTKAISNGNDDQSHHLDYLYATRQSKIILRALIDKAIFKLDQLHLSNGSVTSATGKDVNTKVLMITLLWNQAKELNFKQQNRIIIRGHAVFININATYSSPLMYDPNPINATIALPKRSDSNALPSRHFTIPTAKLSGWCGARRPLERHDAFKPPGIGEVFLVKKETNLSGSSEPDDRNDNSIHWEILEGLTSNLFVVYRDGTLRTTLHGVLRGYGQQLVLDAAERCVISVSKLPISIDDGRNGLWSEVFITSSVRLIVPLAGVLLPCYRGNNMVLEELWTQCLHPPMQLWKVLYNDMVIHNLYGKE